MIDMPRGKTIIAPSLLSADFAKLGQEVEGLRIAGADWLHFDVMDGSFVPNISIGLPVLASLRKVTNLPIDVHLMIVNPDALLADFVKAGADTLTVQAEACTHLHRTLATIRALGARAGLSLNPHTGIDVVEYVAELLDFVLVMTVNPGFGGQSYIDACTPKIAALRQKYPKLDIQVDGGIKVDNIEKAASAGANIFVSGSGVFGAKNYAEPISEMRKIADSCRDR
ncbi:MAG: ribulose-phosphate 3-epimerase [Bradymonadia bacterium]|jgi:ribulose-phosphate 3-epimerase